MRLLPGMSADLVGAELCKLVASQLSSHLYLVGLEAIANLAPPVQRKGGEAFELWIGKGAATSVSAYRDVTCCSSLVKPFSSALRSAALRLLEMVASPGQTGSGPGGGGTEMARLWADASSHFAQLAGLSISTVFIDLASAFASITRELVLPLPSSEDKLAHRLFSQ